MAAVALYAAMSTDGEKSVHPFFTRVNGLDPILQDEERNSADNQPTGSTPSRISEGSAEKPATDSRRKTAKSEGLASSTKIQKTLNDVIIPIVRNTGDYSVIDVVGPNDDRGEPRPKRRRTNGSDPGEIQPGVTQIQHTVVQDGEGNAIPRTSVNPSQSALSLSDDATAVHPSLQPATAPLTPPKKMLRLKANGRFSSPVSPRVKSEIGRCESRTGKKRSSRGKPMSCLLVKIAYKHNAQGRDLTADTINRILSGEERYMPISMPGPMQNTPQEPKATHPFFLTKAKAEPPAPKQPSPRKASAVTPGKLRRQTFASHAKDVEQSTSDSWASGLLRDRLMVKHPGAREPPFPHRGQVHVRDVKDISSAQPMSDESFGLLYGRRKYKESRLPFPERDSIIFHMMSTPPSAIDPLLRADGFHDPLPSLHVPQRRLLRGVDILQRTLSQLHTRVSSRASYDREGSLPQAKSEPALQRLVQDIPTTLTAFDNVGGEMFAWTQKYAPKTADDVLQPKKVMLILKDWLESLKVQTVSNTILKDPKTIPKPPIKPKKKRKKRTDDLDDFLVDSDEDVHDMSEVLDLENDSSTELGRSLKSIVQASHGGSKLSNAILISGPPGCGKTAAAYAVARELDFKVFEINPGERRGGKDVIERVGDMAENHLVKHHGNSVGEPAPSEDPGQIDEAFHRDLESGRQGKMNAFFKPQATSKPSERKKPKARHILKSVEQAIKRPRKEQQQSLILLEEVDILFRDDKDFWATVLKLIVDSKRPFIMTCNDEDIVPLQAIKLHAILRLTQPPEDIAVDYVLLVAAAEGHLLDREAVSSLYRSKRYDLRATLTQLDFWCQMGIGDPRGGLSWIYQRYPPGSDVDEQNRKLRVVSDGTYTRTVGLVPDDDEPSVDRMLHWAWTEFDVDPTIALGWDELHGKVDIPSERIATEPAHQFAALTSFANLTDNLSTADVCCAFNFPGKPSLDTTTPIITDKGRCQYIEGLGLLQTDEYIDHAHLNEELFVSMSSQAFRANGYTDTISPSAAERVLPYITAEKKKTVDRPTIGRRSFACFDAIAAADDNAPPTGTGMTQSAFDGPLGPIVLDLAPYTRSIVRYDRALEEQRERIEQLTSDGRRAKRVRTTRAARSALEGGQRATTRRERWFPKSLEYDAVLVTGGDGWQGGVVGSLREGSGGDSLGSPSPSATSIAGVE